jgi:uncharacterized protein (TIGR02246 family)
MSKLRLAFVFAFLGVMAVVIPRSAAQQSADEQQIRNLDREWVATAAKKDAGAIARFYAEDGAILPPGQTIAQGRVAITAVWSRYLSLKDFTLDFSPTKITVAAAGDLAYDIGTYSLSFETEKGTIRDNGKYVVVWKKINAEWKVAADIFNSSTANP